MLSGKNIKAAVIFLFVIAVALANGVPTVSNNDETKIHPCDLPPASDAHSSSVLDPPYQVTGLEQNQIIESSSSHLATIAEELLKPPACFMSSPVIRTDVRPLPAVPKAIYMALVGFVCVSLVKDRKVWLTVVTTILWAGQVGITALPRKCRVCLAHHLNKRWAVPTIPCLSEQSSRAHRNVDDTEYIGLLSYLEEIPATDNSEQRTDNSVQRTAYTLNAERCKNSELRTTNNASQFAIDTFYPYFIPQTIRLAKIAEHSNYFSPAFIFPLLPRGPPKVA